MNFKHDCANGEITVFISYSHDSDKHGDLVLSLSERLRHDGIATILDKYVNGSPPEGWSRWMMNGFAQATHVLCVCTETYGRRFLGQEVPGKGKGADWEGAIVTRELYDFSSRTNKFIPVLFVGSDEPHIPLPLRPRTHYLLNSDSSYQALYDALLGQAGVEPGAIGELKRKPRANVPPLIFGGNPNVTIDTIERLNKEFIDSRRDPKCVKRSESMHDLLKRSESLESDFSCLELRTMVWRQLSLNARTLKDLNSALEKTTESFYALLNCISTAQEETIALESLAEWAVDFAQSAGASFARNKMVALLNEAISRIGKQLGLHDDPSMDAQKKCKLLCMRAKCRRTLANVYQKRSQNGKDKKQISQLKRNALNDAHRAHGIRDSQANQLELALCLFANSATADTDNAQQGMDLLKKASDSGHFLASYELVKQLKLRHKFKEAAELFISIATQDDDKRRFDFNVTHFAASVRGMHYSAETPTVTREYALKALDWLDKAISRGHYTAREIVDECHIKAICGFPVDDSLKSLSNLKPTSEMKWNEIAVQAALAFEGNPLAGAILLGLEDPEIWSRIGTLYSDYSEDFDQAIDFYEYASSIDRNSPVFHFNKARTFQYKKHDSESAKRSYDQAIQKKNNKYGWYKSNKIDFEKLEAEINANIGGNKQLVQQNSRIVSHISPEPISHSHSVLCVAAAAVEFSTVRTRLETAFGAGTTVYLPDRIDYAMEYRDPENRAIWRLVGLSFQAESEAVIGVERLCGILNPTLVLMVGMCMGMPKMALPVGTVIVPNEVISFNHQRLTVSGT